MYDPSRNGHQSWGMPSPGEILLRIESRLGGLETGQDMTLDEMRSGFDRIERKADHAHARTTELKGRMDSLERFVSTTKQAGTGATPTQGRPGWLQAATELCQALGETLPRIRDMLAALLLLAAGLGLVVDKADQSKAPEPPVERPSAP